MFKKICSCVALLLGVASTSLHAANAMQTDIDNATIVLQNFQKTPGQMIPDSVIKGSKGIAILNIVKAAFLVGGRGGYGIVMSKLSSGNWSAPSAIGLGGAGLGLQVGFEVTDLILVLNTQAAVNAFMNGGNFFLGANISTAAGPVGSTVEKGILPNADVLCYSRNKGLFAGISLEGTAIEERRGVNEEFYGKPVSAKDLLSGKISQPKTAKDLYKQLNSF